MNISGIRRKKEIFNLARPLIWILPMDKFDVVNTGKR